MRISTSIRILFFITTIFLNFEISLANEWVRSWGGTGTETSGRLAVSGSDYIFASTTSSYGSGQNDVMITKTDSTGQLIWQQVIGTQVNEGANGMAVSSNGDIYVTGDVDGQGGKDIYLAKLNSAGDILWTKSFPDSIYETAKAIAISDSGIAISSQVGNSPFGFLQIKIIGIDTSGVQLWSQSFMNPNGSLRVYDIAPLHDGGFITAGSIVIRLDAQGDTIWTKKFVASNLEVQSCIQLKGDSLIAFGANRYIIILRMNGDIKFQQQNASGGTYGIAACSDGNFAIISSTNRVIQKFSYDGIQIWGHAIQYNFAFYIKQSSDNGFIISGQGNFGSNSQNLLMMKTDINGNCNTYSGITPTVTGISYPICMGDTITISVPGNYDSYQWFSSHETPNLLPGETDSILNIISEGNSRSIYCVMTTGFTHIFSNVVSYTVYNTYIPEITGVNNFCYPGNSPKLEFYASNFHRYQWNLNGIPIPGATQDEYYPVFSGTYTVSARRDCDTVISEPVIVNTHAPPAATLNTYSTFDEIILNTGTYCNFSNTLYTPVLPGNTFTWLYNSNPFGGTTNQLTPNNAGTYQVVTTNACGVDTSNASTHNINYINFPIGTNGPTSGCGIDTVVLQGPYFYPIQWYKNGVPISGSTFDTLIVTTSGNYSAVVELTCDWSIEMVATNSISVTINTTPPPSITASGNTTVCSGGVLLTATPGATSYQWRKNYANILGANAPTYMVDSTGIYSCRIVTPSCGNIFSNQIEIMIGSPVATISCNNTNICQGSSTTIYTQTPFNYVNPYTFYHWRKDGVLIPGANSTNYQATMQGLYDCMLVNICDTIYTNSLTVNVFSIPDITSSSGTFSFCEGDSLTLIAANGLGYTYTWYFSNSLVTGITSSNYTINQPGFYRVLVNANGCSILSDNILISKNNLPIANIWPGSNPVLCAADSVHLHANSRPDYIHEWYLNNVPIINTLPDLYVSTAGNYSVNITDSNGCSQISPDFGIYTNTLSAVNISVNPVAPYCIGDTVTLTCGYPGVTYQWYFNNAIIPGAINSTINTINPGFYSVLTSNTQGCSGSASINLNAPFSPQFTFSVNPSTCGNLNGGSTIYPYGVNMLPFSYDWSTGDTTNFINGRASGFYSVTVTDAAGCMVMDTIEITNNLNINVQLYAQQDTLCAGDSTRITAYGPAGSSYLWNNGNTTNYIYTNQDGIYIVTATDSSGCTGTDTINIILAPVLNFSMTVNGNACPGNSILLDAGSGYSNYYWNIGANTSFINATYSENYIVTVTDSFGCSYTDSVNLQFSNPLVLNITGDTITCNGSLNLLDAGQGFAGYLWNTGDITPTINTPVTGFYSVTVNDSNGCQAMDSIYVTVNPVPVVTITASGPTTFCQGQNVTLNAGPGFNTYQWFNYGVPLNLQTNQSYVAFTSGNFKCVVTNIEGCTDTSNVARVRVPCISPDPPHERIIDNEQDTYAVTIYPVPAKDQITISFYADEIAALNIPLSIYDINGKILLQKNIITSQGQNEHVLELKNYTAGVYILSMEFYDNIVFKKLVID